MLSYPQSPQQPRQWWENEDSDDSDTEFASDNTPWRKEDPAAALTSPRFVASNELNNNTWDIPVLSSPLFDVNEEKYEYGYH